MVYNSVYIPHKLIQRFINIISIAAIIALFFMNYDIEYKLSILLPITYMISFHIFIKGFMLRGIGSIALVGMYAFRMCLLPILCAYGNFYIEPSKSIYMNYFGIAIILMCIECVIVMASLSHYSKKYSNRMDWFQRFNDRGIHESIIILFVLVALTIYAIIAFIIPSFLLNHYHFLISTIDEASMFELGNATLQNYGALYYIAIILELTARPIVSFALMNWALKKNERIGVLIAVFIGLFNILWLSDRRVLSLLIGVCCLFQVLFHMRTKLTKHALYWMIGTLAVVTIVYCFAGEDTPIRVARKFQRYFSGPSLTAIGVAVYINYFQTPIEFLKLLFNDSILLTGLFGPFPVRGYVLELCGPAGYSIWTPMFIGAIQYFHMFAPLLLVGIVKFLVYTDYRSQASDSDLRKMMLNYLAIAISVYMVMYSIELVYYNIIFIGGFYYLLLSINNNVKFTLGSRRNYL